MHKGIKELRDILDELEYTEEQIKEVYKCITSYEYFNKYLKLNTKLPYETLDQQFITGNITREDMIAYMLHYNLSYTDRTMVITSHTLKDAQSLLSQLKEVYIQLPEWLQIGVTSWTKRDIQFGNNNRIVASSMTACGIRGFGVDMMMCENTHLVDNELMTEFMEYTLPVIACRKYGRCWISGAPGFSDEFDNVCGSRAFTGV